MSRKWWEPAAEEPQSEPRWQDEEAGYLDPANLTAGGMHGWLPDRRLGGTPSGAEGDPPEPGGAFLRRWVAFLLPS